MSGGVEELDGAGAKPAHREPFSVGGDRYPIGLNTDVVDDVAQQPRLGVDHSDGPEDWVRGHSNDRVLLFIDVPALTSDEEFRSVSAERARPRPMADAHFGEDLIRGDVDEGHRAIELIADPELVGVRGVYGDSGDLGVLGDAWRDKQSAGAEGVKQACYEC